MCGSHRRITITVLWYRCAKGLSMHVQKCQCTHMHTPAQMLSVKSLSEAVLAATRPLGVPLLCMHDMYINVCVFIVSLTLLWMYTHTGAGTSAWQRLCWYFPPYQKKRTCAHVHMCTRVSSLPSGCLSLFFDPLHMLLHITSWSIGMIITRAPHTHTYHHLLASISLCSLIHCARCSTSLSLTSKSDLSASACSFDTSIAFRVLSTCLSCLFSLSSRSFSIFSCGLWVCGCVHEREKETVLMILIHVNYCVRMDRESLDVL